MAHLNQTHADAQPLAQYEALDWLGNACAIVDADTAVLYCNSAMEHVLAISRGVLAHRRLLLADCFAQPELLHQGMAHLRSGKAQTWRCEATVRPFEPVAEVGAARPVQHVVLTQMPDTTAGMQRFLLELVDLSRIDQSERELRSLQQSVSSRELIRNLAHEVKNPLGGIQGAAQLLQADAPAEWQAYLQVILGETQRLQSLVDRLLLPHRQQFVPLPLNVHEVCEYVRPLILSQYPQGLQVRRDYDTSLPLIRADKAQLIQVLLNLAQNAAQAMREQVAAGTALLTLKTRIAYKQTFAGKTHKLALLLQVQDNGPGVPDEMHDTLFLPLVTGREGGSGLGLALAHAFVLQHGGSMRFERQAGCTSFDILLPIPA